MAEFEPVMMYKGDNVRIARSLYEYQQLLWDGWTASAEAVPPYPVNYPLLDADNTWTGTNEFVQAPTVGGQPIGTGEKGDPGPAGAAGAKWYTGTAAPASSLGVEGDFHLLATTGEVREKTASGWVVRGTIRGPQGLQGAPGPAGADSTVPGPEGPVGPAGPEGPASTVPGPQGPAGPEGPASTVPGPQGPAGPGVPTGGLAGQALLKLSGTDYDTGWGDVAAQAPETTVLEPPQWFDATSPRAISSDTIVGEYVPSAGADSHTLERAGDTLVEQSISGGSFLHGGLLAATTYTFRIRADKAGSLPAYSEPREVTTLAESTEPTTPGVFEKVRHSGATTISGSPLTVRFLTAGGAIDSMPIPAGRLVVAALSGDKALGTVTVSQGWEIVPGGTYYGTSVTGVMAQRITDGSASDLACTFSWPNPQDAAAVIIETNLTSATRTQGATFPNPVSDTAVNSISATTQPAAAAGCAFVFTGVDTALADGALGGAWSSINADPQITGGYTIADRIFAGADGGGAVVAFAVKPTVVDEATAATVSWASAEQGWVGVLVFTGTPPGTSTTALPPSAPVAAAGAVTYNTAKGLWDAGLDWAPPTTPNGTIQGYEFHIESDTDPNPGFQPPGWAGFEVAPSDPFVFGNLASEETYRLRYRVYNEHLPSDWSNVITVTPPAAPAQPAVLFEDTLTGAAGVYFDRWYGTPDNTHPLWFANTDTNQGLNLLGNKTAETQGNPTDLWFRRFWMNGGVSTYNGVDYGDAGPLGGPGQDLKVTIRVKVKQWLDQSSWPGIEGIKFMMRWPNESDSDQSSFGARGSSPSSDAASCYAFLATTHRTARFGFLHDQDRGSSYEPDIGIVGLTTDTTRYYTYVVTLEWIGTKSLKMTLYRDGVYITEGTYTNVPDAMRPGYLGIRTDYTTFYCEANTLGAWYRVEPLHPNPSEPPPSEPTEPTFLRTYTVTGGAEAAGWTNGTYPAGSSITVQTDHVVCQAGGTVDTTHYARKLRSFPATDDYYIDASSPTGRFILRADFELPADFYTQSESFMRWFNVDNFPTALSGGGGTVGAADADEWRVGFGPVSTTTKFPCLMSYHENNQDMNLWQGSSQLAVGRHTVEVDFTPNTPGATDGAWTLTIDGTVTASASNVQTVPESVTAAERKITTMFGGIDGAYDQDTKPLTVNLYGLEIEQPVA